MIKDKEWFESVIIKELMTNSGNSDMTTYEQGRVSALKYYLNLIDQLEEPEKVVVPDFVANWFERNKDDLEYQVYSLVVDSWQGRNNKKLEDWLQNKDTKPIETLFKMKHGYTIEQPKLLTVIVKDSDETVMTKQLSEDEVNKMMEGLEK